MAGYTCTECDGQETAVVLVTPLSGAETMAIGPNCMPVAWCGLFAGVAGIDPAQLWDAAVAIATAQAAAGAQADADAGASPAGGQPAPGEQPAGISREAPARPGRRKAANPRRPRASAAPAEETVP